MRKIGQGVASQPSRRNRGDAQSDQYNGAARATQSCNPIAAGRIHAGRASR